MKSGSILHSYCGSGRTLLVSTHDLAEVFWIELTSEMCGPDQIAEHHRELAAFGLRRMAFE
jgi:hypothetical protein